MDKSEYKGFKMNLFNVVSNGLTVTNFMEIESLLTISIRAQARRNHSGSNRHRLHGLEHHTVILSGFSPNGEPKLTSVAIHGPNGDGVEGTGAEVGAVALEGDAHEAAAHFFDELVGGDRKFKEERGLGVEAVVLDAEPDVAAAVSEDGADDHCLGGASGGLVGVVVLDVVSERGAEAFLGRGNGGGGRYGGGGGEAREYASTESVDLGHGFLMGVEEKKGMKEEKEEENGVD
uniref:Uncharacterized protein n=1 Tax=Vitis vinifera TaxID=29760 RepID=A5AHA4_VITVI|nr:hypothetical protein VITISV_024378 [Vitis vinifera]